MNKFISKLEELNFNTRENCFIAIIFFLIGLILGGLLSPKGKRIIGSNNGNNNTGYVKPGAVEDEE